MVNKQRLYWTLQVVGWSVYAVIQIFFSYVSSSTRGSRLSRERIEFLIYEAVLCLLLTHGYRYVMNHWRWMHLGIVRLFPRVILSVLCLGILAYFLRLPVSLPLGLYSEATAFDPQVILGQSFYYWIIFFIWSSLYFIYNYFERYNTSLKLEASVKEVELNNLKSQLNPHFIFNALNSIRALVDENPGKSKEAINQLSNILRNSLVTEKKELTSFSEELKIVKDYLGLESIRYEERLRTEFDIDPESNQFLVPPLMVQTLVENGIKHGISKLKEGGLIQVKTRVDNDYLKIYIRNSGSFQLNGNRTNSGGVGLDNTRQRLKLIYGHEASFRILTENENFVLTEIIIPHLY